MIKIQVIGAGGIGMRHLQSIAGLKEPFECWAVDPREESLGRVRQILSGHDKVACFHYVNSMSETPDHADVVIVATSSLVRAQVTRDLLNSKSVKYLILEKFLFPTESDYGEIGNLIKKKGVSCWVNTPRRMNPGWQTVIGTLKGFNGLLRYSVLGGNWGLGCNSIHFLDTIDFLLGNDAAFSYDTSELDPEIGESKRPGYVEFTGKLRVGHPRAASIELISDRSNNAAILQIISTDTIRFVISEFEQRARRATLEGGWKMEKIAFPMLFQSQLTAPVIESLIESGSCLLTPYEHSAKLHIPMLRTFLDYYNKAEGKDDEICPIT